MRKPNSRISTTDLANSKLASAALGLDESAPANCMARSIRLSRTCKRFTYRGCAQQRTEIDLMTVALKAGLAQLSLARLELTPAAYGARLRGEKKRDIPIFDQLEFDWWLPRKYRYPYSTAQNPLFTSKSWNLTRQPANDARRSQAYCSHDVLRRLRMSRVPAKSFEAAHKHPARQRNPVRIAICSTRRGSSQPRSARCREQVYAAKFARRAERVSLIRLSKFALMQVTGFDFVAWANAGGK